MQSAKSAAQRLLEERLIACANVLGEGQSFFRWEGVVQETQEVVMILKTTENTMQKAIDKLTSLHPYTNPCMCALSADKGSDAFLRWVHTECDAV